MREEINYEMDVPLSYAVVETYPSGNHYLLARFACLTAAEWFLAAYGRQMDGSNFVVTMIVEDGVTP